MDNLTKSAKELKIMREMLSSKISFNDKYLNELRRIQSIIHPYKDNYEQKRNRILKEKQKMISMLYK